MKAIKRLDVTPRDAYEKALRAPIRFVSMSEAEFRALEVDRPELILDEDAGVLIGRLHDSGLDVEYGFRDRDAFARLFASMFQRLAALVAEDDAPMGFRLRLTDHSNRPYVEPILIAQAFELCREWMRMQLLELAAAAIPDDEIAPGFRLRPVLAGDIPAIIELEELAFPNPSATVEAVQTGLQTAALYRVLEETSTRAIVGSLLAELREPSAGHIANVAVHPDYQRRGLGEAIMRWTLGWGRERGLRRATLTVNVDNAAAIALYRKLGFSAGEIGLDYRRPIAEEEVRHVLEKHAASHISVRPRWAKR